MAESNEENNDGKNYFQNSKTTKELNDSNDESDEPNPTPDIGLGSGILRSRGRKTMMDNTSIAGFPSDVLPRRDENPFSFKHFLNRDNSNGLPVGGARPKVFTSPAPNSPSGSEVCSPSACRLMSNPELASGLPDFVQDHLVIEQCYLSNNTKGPAHLAVDFDKLPDFAPIPNENHWSPDRQPADIPFDLTSNRRERVNDVPPVPLDLPESFPFDLPVASGEVGASKSLPDFLSDGPIHSERRNDNSQPVSEDNSPTNAVGDTVHSPRLQMENERLRRELDATRRQLIDQVRKNELLEAELAALRNREYEDTSGLYKMIENIEDNLKRTTKRAITAESRVSKLKQEMKTLTNEVTELRSQGASSLHCMNPNPQRIACELRTAASTAEMSLRQLLNGVDNLRVIASSLENRQHIEEDPSDFLDSDSISESGPAL